MLRNAHAATAVLRAQAHRYNIIHENNGRRKKNVDIKKTPNSRVIALYPLIFDGCRRGRGLVNGERGDQNIFWFYGAPCRAVVVIYD